ncbi:MAG: hypothetical protein WEG56_13595 [Chloroflexota bacterium]
MRFRREFGLRFDRPWIEHVAADRASTEGLEIYGIPLLPAEVAELLARVRVQRDITPIILRYGSTQPDSWAGVFIDQAAGGAVVAQFARDLARHERQLRALLPAGARFEVREVRWTRAELDRFAGRIIAEQDWFATIGLEFYAAEVDEESNLVRVRYRGPSDDRDGVIAAHFGTPDWLLLVATPPLWTGPLGDLTIQIVDRDGRPVQMTCLIETADPGVPSGGGVRGAGEDGTCLWEDLPTVRFHIRITASTASDEDIIVDDRIHLVPPGPSILRIVVDVP